MLDQSMEVNHKGKSIEEVSIKQCIADSEIAMEMYTSKINYHVTERLPDSPKTVRPTTEGCGIWHTTEDLSTLETNTIPDVVIGFDGMNVDPESKHK